MLTPVDALAAPLGRIEIQVEIPVEITISTGPLKEIQNSKEGRNKAAALDSSLTSDLASYLASLALVSLALGSNVVAQRKRVLPNRQS